MVGDGVSGKHMKVAQTKLKEFNAKRKFKVFVIIHGLSKGVLFSSACLVYFSQ